MFPENYECLDYVKFGPYEESSGGLDKRTTNQVLYKVETDDFGELTLEDETYKFWKN